MEWKPLNSSVVAEVMILVDCFPVAAKIGRVTLCLTSKEIPQAIRLSQQALCCCLQIEDTSQNSAIYSTPLGGDVMEGACIVPRKGTSFHYTI